MWDEEAAGVGPGSEEAGVDGAVLALWFVVAVVTFREGPQEGLVCGKRGGCRCMFCIGCGGCAERGRVLVAREGDVFGWICGEVDDGVGDGISAAKGEDNALLKGRMGEGNVSTRVGEKGTGIPRLLLVNLFVQR